MMTQGEPVQPGETKGAASAGRETKPKRGFGYWFPRLLVISAVVSVWFNLPKYLHGMDERQYVVWLARVAWVVGLPLVFAGVIALIGRRSGR